MKIQLEKLVPTRAEILFCGFLALLIGILSNAKLLLAKQDLTSAATAITSGASKTLSEGLSKLDEYAFTTTAVTFLVWAVIGLLTLSVIQAIGYVLSEFNEQSRLSSNEFVHPTDFSRRSFWKSVFLTTLGSFFVALVSTTYVLIFCLYLLPLGRTYLGAYFSDFAPSGLGYAAIGVGVLFVSIIGLNVVARLLRFRHQLTKVEHTV